MSSHARRGLRTTAAVAGLAALGVGLAAPAFAAPELPAAPALPQLPGAPDPAAAESALASLPSPTSMNPADLPPLFTFEMPKVETGMPTPSVPEVSSPALPSLPSADKVVNTDMPAPALPDPTQVVHDNSFGVPTAAPDTSALPTADAMSIIGHMVVDSPKGGPLSGN